MPTSLKESWRPSQSPNSSEKSSNSREEGPEESKALLSLELDFGNLKLKLETRFFVIAFMIPPLYMMAAFVGNDWAYMLPCTLLASLFIGVLLPLLEIASLCCKCTIISEASSSLEQQVLLLKVWRRPFLGLLSALVPSGYLNARLHLARKTWGGCRPAGLVPLPVVLQSIGQGLEVQVPAPQLKRGVYEIASLEITTCFPFAFAWWSRLVSSDEFSGSLSYLPQLREVPGNFHSRLDTGKINSGRNQKHILLQQRSSNLKGLREFTERDSLNHIHWAASARSGRFMVREFELESLPDFDLYIDLCKQWNEQQLDLACATAFSLVHYAARNGFVAELRLNPAMDWPPLSALLEDISPGLDHEELVCQILARLSPLPIELQKEYRLFTESRNDDAIDILCSDITASQRSLIELLPEDKGKAAKAIMLTERTEFSQGVGAATTTAISRLEAESELHRL